MVPRLTLGSTDALFVASMVPTCVPQMMLPGDQSGCTALLLTFATATYPDIKPMPTRARGDVFSRLSPVDSRSSLKSSLRSLTPCLIACARLNFELDIIACGARARGFKETAACCTLPTEREGQRGGANDRETKKAANKHTLLVQSAKL